MNWIVIVLSIVGGLFLLLLCYFQIDEWIDDYRVKKMIKEEKKQATAVSEYLNSAHYWLNSPERKPYRELVEFIRDELKQYSTVRGERLREKVDAIIKNSITPQP